MAIVRLHLTLIEMAEGRQNILVEDGKSVRLTTLLDRLGVPYDEVGIVVRNRKMDDIDCMIDPDDVVELFPILSGG